LTGAIAIFTKENAAILPFAIFLFDLFFLPRRKQSIWCLILYLLPYFAAPVWMVLSKMVIPIIYGKGLRDVTGTTDPAKSIQISKEADFSYLLSYLVTEFSVLWLYIRLLFLPYGQALDYQYPLVNSLITIKNMLAFLGLSALLSTAWIVRIRQPLVSFAILWFFITLSVESTIIPLDPVFEHRLYVPMFGFALLLPQILKWVCPENPKYLIIILIIVVYGILTWNRNELWSNETAFYEDQLNKVPHGTRVMICVSKIYIDSKRYTEAEVLLRKAILIDSGTEKAYVNLTSLLVKNNRLEEALQVFQQGLKANPNSRELYNNLGVFYNLVGKQDLAIQSLLKSISIPPPYAEAYTNLGVVYADQKRWEDAERCYRLGISVLYENPKAHFNLGVALFSTGRMAEAAEAFKITLKFAPLDSWALYNLACVYIELGNAKAALDILPGLRKIDQQLSYKLENELGKQKYLYSH
jgi:tetratricopeptide (TPR) repeat protein